MSESVLATSHKSTRAAEPSECTGGGTANVVRHRRIASLLLETPMSFLYSPTTTESET